MENSDLRKEILNEYLELFQRYGKMTRDDYVKNSQYLYQYRQCFKSYTHLVFEAENVDTSKYDFGYIDDLEIKNNPRFYLPRKERKYTLPIENAPDRYIKILILSDLHIPFHNETALDKVLTMLGDTPHDCLIINGDFNEMFAISKFNENSLKDLEGITLGYEYKIANIVREKLDNACNWWVKIFGNGNHEDRFNKFMRTGDNKKLEGALISPIQALNLKASNYIILDNSFQDFIEVGNNLEVFHGVYHNKYFTNKTAEHLLKNAIIGHLHTLQIFTAANGITCYSLGFMGDLDYNLFNYANRLTKQRWKTGFLSVTLDCQTSKFWVKPVVIEDNEFEFNGKIY